MNNLTNYSAVTSQVYKPVRKFTSVKTEWYDELYHKAKAIIMKDAYMKFYSVIEPLYLKADVPGVGPGIGLLLV